MQFAAYSDRLTSKIIPIIAAVFASSAALGQLAPPMPIGDHQPATPTNRFGGPMEGWAVVRYSVLADGTTANVRVVDRMPASLAERELRAAVQAWTFEPATSDGVAVDWHNGDSVIVFDADTIPPEPRNPFVRGYQEVEAFLAEEEYDDARRRSRRLIDTEAARLAEIGVALVQNARVHIALGNLYEAYAAIERATDSRMSLLAPSELIVALEYRNTLELRLGDMVGALETFARRQALGPVPQNDPMAQSAAAIRSGLEGEAAIAVKGKILDDVWSHDLERRTFAIGDLDGNLSRVDVACDRGTAELEYSEEAEWSLPESWGACKVAVSGRRDSLFVLYEFQ